MRGFMKYACVLALPLLVAAGAAQAQMGAGREMGAGWITVTPEAIADDDRLTFWVDVAMHHNRAVTSKRPAGG